MSRRWILSETLSAVISDCTSVCADELEAWRWRFVRYWSILYFRRRIVVGMTLLGLFVSLGITIVAPQRFSSRAVVRDNGANTNGEFLPDENACATNTGY